MGRDWAAAEVVLEQNGRVVAVYKLGRNALGQWVLLHRDRPYLNERQRGAERPCPGERSADDARERSADAPWPRSTGGPSPEDPGPARWRPEEG
jgi:hypothetical protein